MGQEQLLTRIHRPISLSAPKITTCLCAIHVLRGKLTRDGVVWQDGNCAIPLTVNVLELYTHLCLMFMCSLANFTPVGEKGELVRTN